MLPPPPLPEPEPLAPHPLITPRIQDAKTKAEKRAQKSDNLHEAENLTETTFQQSTISYGHPKLHEK
jgi:hypothetical protein